MDFFALILSALANLCTVLAYLETLVGNARAKFQGRTLPQDDPTNVELRKGGDTDPQNKEDR